MEAPFESAADETTRLRRCLNDLLSIMALPAVWTGGEPRRIVSTLLDALLRTLDLDLAFVRFTDPDGGASIEMVRAADSLPGTGLGRELSEAIDSSVGGVSREWPAHTRVFVGGGDLSLASAGLGLHGEIGAVVAGSQQPNFPAETD